jgi:hypothetical protein
MSMKIPCADEDDRDASSSHVVPKIASKPPETRRGKEGFPTGLRSFAFTLLSDLWTAEL